MSQSENKIWESYDFETLYDFYNYLFESWINGNKQQTERLFFEMDKQEQLGFVSHIKEYCAEDDQVTWLERISVWLIETYS